jgi:IS30 family transposase
MISPETRAQIRRYFYAEHWKIGTIANELGVHPDTVRNAIRVAAPRRCAAVACLRGRSLPR